MRAVRPEEKTFWGLKEYTPAGNVTLAGIQLASTKAEWQKLKIKTTLRICINLVSPRAFSSLLSIEKL